MKCQIPEISWHNRDPVLSVDIQATDKPNVLRLASGGTDSHVLIWYLTKNDDSGSVTLDVAADLTRHQRAVNVVRWSPSGEFLASGDDESVIFIWKQKSENETVNIMESTNEQDKEIWITYKILRGHMEDVYDLSWSPNSTQLISGSVDNTAMMWDIHKGKSFHILNEHKGFVQGVAWDPNNQYLATLSTDRHFRVYDINTKKVISRCSKSQLPVPKDHQLHGKTLSLFHDDTLQTFFRRLSFSPDGQLVITPAGVTELDDANAKPLHTTYIFTRNSFKQPAIVLPSPDQFTVAVKFCPVLFELRPQKQDKTPVIPLHYRMIFAVATKSSVYLYDTQQRTPFALISNIHYARLTDLAWSPDGTILIVSSTDGFCSIITFADDELGKIYQKTEEEIENDKRNQQQPQPVERTNKKKHRNSDAVKSTPSSAKKPSNGAESKSDEVEVVEEIKTDIAVVTDSLRISDKVIPEIIVPSDKIIRSDDKFESPEKKNKPVTPIPIRRHPRVSENTPSRSPLINGSPQPIAIKRRALITPTTPTSSKTTNSNEDDAMDCWPSDQSRPTPNAAIFDPVKHKYHVENDVTEDFQLVLDDDDEEEEQTNSQKDNKNVEPETSDAADAKPDKTEKEEKVETPNPKTPRRVEFRTISTPKSKKKLIE